MKRDKDLIKKLDKIPKTHKQRKRKDSSEEEDIMKDDPDYRNI